MRLIGDVYLENASQSRKGIRLGFERSFLGSRVYIAFVYTNAIHGHVGTIAGEVVDRAFQGLSGKRLRWPQKGPMYIGYTFAI